MDTIPASTLLPIRRRMLPDEWPETYLSSLARLQGVRKPWSRDVDRIRSVLPWEPVEPVVPPRGGATQGGWTYLQGRPQYGPLPLPAWATFVRAVSLRYCPICLVEARYIRTRWRISGLTVCTLHGCLLKSNLAEPAITANYKRHELPTIAGCDDAKLLEDAVCCLPREFHAASMVWARLEEMAQRSQSPREDGQLGVTASWAVLLWRMLGTVSRIHHKKVIKQPTTGTLHGVGRLMEDLSVSVAPSREGVLALLEGLSENAHVLAARRLLDAVKREEKESPTALSTLPLDDLSERLASAAPQASSRALFGGVAFRDLYENALDERAVVEELTPLGAGQDVITRWVRQKVIRTMQSRSRGARGYRFIDRDEVRQARKFLLSLIHARDFIAEHDLDWLTYEALRKTGLIGEDVPGMRRFIRRSELSLLQDRLELVSTPGSGESPLRWRIFCKEAVYAAEQRTTFETFVRAAMCGRFSVYRDLTRPGLAAFSVGVDGIAWLANRRRSFFWTRKGTRGQAQADLFDQEELGLA